MNKTDIKNLIKKIIKKKAWIPLEIVKVNNHVVRLAYFKGKFKWHKHQQDELFYIYQGSITIQVRNKPNITLSKGELVVIPKNVEHYPQSKRGAYVLMYEPSVLKSRGN